jgi:hypothetical protein
MLRTVESSPHATKKVGMIEFHIIQNKHLRQIMQKLWPLVEKSGIVFIAFEHEMPAFAQPEALSEIFRNAADEKARIQARAVQCPGEQAAGRGFAMCAGHDAGIFAANEIVP